VEPASGSPQAPDREWQPEGPEAAVKREVHKTTVGKASGWKQARNQLADRLIAEGVTPKRAARVAEATIRRAQAKEGHSVFHYADVEQEFEHRAREAGHDPRHIEEGKRRVWTAARATASEHGVEVEEALFFCYSETLDVHSDFLIAVATEDEAVEAEDSDA
jgi:hypothetical protein